MKIKIRVILEPKTKFTVELETVDTLTHEVLTHIKYKIIFKVSKFSEKKSISIYKKKNKKTFTKSFGFIILNTSIRLKSK